MLFALRYLAEVRPAAAYFEDLAEQPAEAAHVALTQQLIESKSGELEMASSTDRYQAALLDLIKAKVEGAPPVLVPRGDNGSAISLREDLRQGVAQAQP